MGGEPKVDDRMDSTMGQGVVGYMVRQSVGFRGMIVASSLWYAFRCLAGQQGVLYAGCGIVADSQAELEKRNKIKFQPMLRGIGGQV